MLTRALTGAAVRQVLLAGVAVEVWSLAPVAVGLCGVVVVMVAAGTGGKVRRAFDVQKGDAPLVLDMNL
jgi:hypothetical protein